MILLQETQQSPLSPCHYLPSETWRFDYFFASELTGTELEHYLDRGWRKFGFYYFKPSCPHCRKCIPVRVPAREYQPSRSQKRVLSKNRHIRVRFGPLSFNDRIFELYCDHSTNRFGKDNNDPADFFSSFYSPSCPCLQSEYYDGDTLVGVGFLDVSRNGLSSVYFIYDTAYSHLNLGTFSIIREIQETKNRGLSSYYLGYTITECPRMIYKQAFRPQEHYDWGAEEWVLSEKNGESGSGKGEEGF